MSATRCCCRCSPTPPRCPAPRRSRAPWPRAGSRRRSRPAARRAFMPSKPRAMPPGSAGSGPWSAGTIPASPIRSPRPTSSWSRRRRWAWSPPFARSSRTRRSGSRARAPRGCWRSRCPIRQWTEARLRRRRLSYRALPSSLRRGWWANYLPTMRPRTSPPTNPAEAPSTTGQTLVVPAGAGALRVPRLAGGAVRVGPSAKGSCHDVILSRSSTHVFAIGALRAVG